MERHRPFGCLFVRFAILLVAALSASPLTQAANLGNHRALLAYESGVEGSESFHANVEAINLTLVTGGWAVANIDVVPFPPGSTVAQLTAAMTTAFGAAGANNDPKLFYYRGHGFQFDDDTTPDEAAADNKDERMSAFSGAARDLRDDALENVWADYTGTKILIYDSCHSAGLFDGTSDPIPQGDVYFMASVPAAEDSGRGWFARQVLQGLSGKAAGENNEVTVQELKVYLDSRPKQTDVFKPVFRVEGTPGQTVLANVIAPPGPEAPDAPAGPKDCEPAGVPTLSEWGGITLGAVLLVGGVALVRRR